MTDQHNSAFPMSGIASPSNALSLRGRDANNSAAVPSAANLPQSIFNNPAIQPSSEINISNSSEIVIGPMTQYQGPVTIYQFMDATVETRATHANGDIQQTNTTKKSTKLLQRISKNRVVLIALILIIIVSVGSAIYLALGKEDNIPQEILFETIYQSGKLPTLGNGHKVIDRFQWGAADHRLTKPLEHPIPYVLITHLGVQSSPCEDIDKCAVKMKSFQDIDISEQGLPDIKSNFYVGNDGNVYVGRGWDYANTFGDKSLAISFLGDFNQYTPTNKSLEAIQFLLSYAMKMYYLRLDYKLVAQNQTKTTDSPGINVIREIVKWTHWNPCGQSGNPPCGAEIGLPKVWNAKQ